MGTYEPERRNLVVLAPGVFHYEMVLPEQKGREIGVKGLFDRCVGLWSRIWDKDSNMVLESPEDEVTGNT